MLLAADRGARLRLLVWNLFHGRSVPPAGRSLLHEFAAMIAGWEWDVALLQEVPPWWPERLARPSGASAYTGRTSRNAGLALRRAIAERRPDLIKSNGGGSNAVLSRVPVSAHRAVRLRVRPERRVAQLIRLQDGTALANYHGSTRVELAEAELERLWRLLLEFAEGSPLVLAGDLNLRSPWAPPEAVHVAARDVDHVFACGMSLAGAAERLDRTVDVDGRAVELSDHVPLALTLVRDAER